MKPISGKQRLAQEFRDSLSSFKSFSRFCRIYSNRGEYLYFHPDNWMEEQAAFERDRTGRDLIVKSRQIGISTMECLRDLYFALINPGSTVLIVAQDQGTAYDLLRICRNAHEGLAELGKRAGVRLVPKLAKDEAREIQIEGLGRIKCTWAKADKKRAEVTGRGISAGRIHCSEVALWQNSEEAMAALLNTGKNAKEIVLESTPQGASGFFYSLAVACRSGRNHEYRCHFYPFYQNSAHRMPVYDGFDAEPRDQYERLLRSVGCDSEQIAFWRSKAALGLEGALQNYPIDFTLCFRASGSGFIAIDDLDKLAEKARRPIRTAFLETCEISIFAEPIPGRDYILACDPCHGVGGDPAAGYVIDKESGETVASFADNRVAGKVLASILAKLGRLYNGALIAVETQGGGETVIAFLIEMEYFPLFFTDPKTPGWRTDAKTRPFLYSGLVESIRDGSIPIADPELIEELKHISLNPGTQKLEAEKGHHDDRTMAYCIALRVRALTPKLSMEGFSARRPRDIDPGLFGQSFDLKGF